MDIHPWTKYDIAQARHEERLLRARAAMRVHELRAENAGDAGESRWTSSWLDRMRRKGVAVETASARRVLVAAVALGAAFQLLGAGSQSAQALPGSPQGEHQRVAPALAASRRIAREVEQRYRHGGADLRVREIASISVVETVELMPGVSRPGRSVPAGNGIWFAICKGSPCALQRHKLTREGALLARREALELALRTLHETTADLVVVALPKRWVLTVLLVLTRDDLAADRLTGSEADEAVRRHLYVDGGIVPYSGVRDSLLAFPLESRPE